jgi:hypothetical protein
VKPAACSEAEGSARFHAQGSRVELTELHIRAETTARASKSSTTPEPDLFSLSAGNESGYAKQEARAERRMEKTERGTVELPAADDMTGYNRWRQEAEQARREFGQRWTLQMGRRVRILLTGEDAGLAINSFARNRDGVNLMCCHLCLQSWGSGDEVAVLNKGPAADLVCATPNSLQGSRWLRFGGNRRRGGGALR